MLLDEKLLDRVTEQAAASPRLRMNYNLHHSSDSKAQRLFNVLLPGTILPIHRHSHTDETYILVRGRMDVVFYDSERNELERYSLDLAEGRFGVHIPSGTWHTVEVIEPSSIFEVKDGPYAPLGPEDILE